MGTLRQDLKYALRMLAARPGFTVVAILTLALGIGANTAIFSVLYGVVVQPLPFKNPEQLVRLYSEFPTFPGGGLRRFQISAPEFLDLRKDSQSWKTLDGWVNNGANLTGSVQPIRVSVSFVTGSLLDSLGVKPVKGRTIEETDDKPGAQQVAVISEGLWKRAFGGDPGIVDHEVLFNGTQCTVVGIMPLGFEFPPGDTTPPEMWVPLRLDPANPGGRGGHFLFLLGRLNQGVSFNQARDEMTTLVEHYGETAAPNTHAFRPDRHPIVMYPLKDEVIRGIRPALLMLSGAVLFVLMIACVNVANLLLARAEARQREIALRTALGASRLRLARQFVTEGVVLSLAGAVAGVALSYGGLRLLVLTNAGLVPRIAEVSLSWKVLLFALATCLATGVFFGLAPLAHVAAANLHSALKTSSARATASVAARVFRRMLVTTEVALALILLVGSGLMVRGFWNLLQTNAGFNPRNVLTMRLALSQQSYTDNPSLLSFWSRAHERLSSIPGVQSASLVSGLPPIRPILANDTDIEGLVPGPGTPIANVDYWQAVTPDYFKTLGISLLDGRLLEDSDRDGSAPVVVINQAMARHFYGDENPIGRRVRPGSTDPWRTIVGVVADAKNAGLDSAAGTELYMPYTQAATAFGLRQFSVVLRASGASAGAATALTQPATDVIRDLDPGLPVAQVRTMDEVMETAEARPRFLTMLLGLFSAVALVLAAVGIYGLMSYSVAERTQEIGIRIALGAARSDVLRMVLFHGMRITLTGVGVGLLGAFGLTRLMASLLFGVGATDPVTFAGISVVLTVVALGACYVPARRATRVDPMSALRYE